MIGFTGLLLSTLFFFMGFDPIDLDEVRTNYDKLPSDKGLCERMIAELMETKNSSATHLAYLGGAQTIWANHVFSPLRKLNTFKEGKKNIERAIEKEPHTMELRFIRLSVQKNAPSFLGYRSNIHEDTEFIKGNRNQTGSAILQQHIETLLED